MVTRSPFGKGEIMSLKEKAKTKREIWNEPDIIQKPETSVDWLQLRELVVWLIEQREKRRQKHEAEAKIEGDPVSYLLKRVEQEIEEKSENYAKLCARLHEQVIDLTLKNKELKQKLEDAQKEISRVRKERDEMEELANDVANQYSKEHEELKQKLRQLLTEFPKKRWNEAFEWKDYATQEIDMWKKKFEELIQDGC
jgi:predicted RNase H-like nuclease (RuvC/YqgF family)